MTTSNGNYSYYGSTFQSGRSFLPNVTTSTLSLYLSLNQSEAVRLQKCQTNWNFYFGKHWEFQRDENDPLVTRNYVQLIVNKSATWLVKNGFVHNPPDAFKKTLGTFLDNVWTANNKQIFLNELAQIGAVSGDAYIFVTVERPKPGELFQDKHIKVFAKNSQQCFPVVDPQDKSKMVSIRVESFYYDEAEVLAQRTSIDPTKVDVKLKRFTQIFTKDTILEQYEGQQPVVKKNELGEIPVIHIQNLPVAVDFYGMADIDGVIEMQRELNEKCTDASDIISFHGSPLMVGYGFKAAQVEKNTRSFWTGLPAPGAARLEILNSNADLGNAITYISMTKEDMLAISETPKILLDSPPISNASGVALSLQYQPIVDKVTGRKKPLYEKGLTDTNRLILKYGELFNLIYLPRDICKNCEGKILSVVDTGPFARPVYRCYLVDEHFVLTTKETAMKIWNIEEASEIKTEPVVVSTVHVDPTSGETQIIDEKTMELVPTDCLMCKAHDPLDVPVELRDALPRDDQVEVDFWQKLVDGKIVSKAHMRRQIRRINPQEIDKIERELREEQTQEIDYQSKLALAMAPPAPPEPEAGDRPQTPGEGELKRSNELPMGHNQKKNDPEGNKVKP